MCLDKCHNGGDVSGIRESKGSNLQVAVEWDCGEGNNLTDSVAGDEVVCVIGQDGGEYCFGHCVNIDWEGDVLW